MDSERWRQIEELFHAALALEPESQQTFLDGACGPDAGLCREVEALLARGEQAQSFLETQTPETQTVTGGESQSKNRIDRRFFRPMPPVKAGSHMEECEQQPVTSP